MRTRRAGKKCGLYPVCQHPSGDGDSVIPDCFVTYEAEIRLRNEILNFSNLLAEPRLGEIDTMPFAPLGATALQQNPNKTFMPHRGYPLGLIHFKPYPVWERLKEPFSPTFENNNRLPINHENFLLHPF